MARDASFEAAWQASEPLFEACRKLAEPGAALQAGDARGVAGYLLDEMVVNFDPIGAGTAGLKAGSLALAALAARMSVGGMTGRAAAFEAVEQRTSKAIEFGVATLKDVRRILGQCGEVHDAALTRAADEAGVSETSLADTGIPLSWRRKQKKRFPSVVFLVTFLCAGAYFFYLWLNYAPTQAPAPRVPIAPKIEELLPPPQPEQEPERQELPWDSLEAFFASEDGIAALLPSSYSTGFLSGAVAIADACNGDAQCIDESLGRHFKEFLSKASKTLPEGTRNFKAITKGRGQKFRNEFYALLVDTARADKELLAYLVSRAGMEKILRPADGEENPVLKAYDTMAGVCSLFPYDDSCGMYIKRFGTEELAKCIDEAKSGTERTQCACNYTVKMRDALMDAVDEFVAVSGAGIDPATVVRKCANLGAYLSSIRFFIARVAYRNTDFYRYLDAAAVFDVRARWFRALAKWHKGENAEAEKR